MRRWMLYSGLLCISLLLSCGGDTLPVQVGERAPDFSLLSLDGSEVESSSLKGEVVILNFWATWCQPCLKEIPELKEMAAESSIKIIGIALDKEGARTVQPFVDKHEINYPILIGNETIFQQFNGFGIPHTVILNADYHIAKVFRGRVTRQSLEEGLAEL